jgi:hypothetical protein
MNKLLVVILGVFILIMTPTFTMAKSHGKENDSSHGAAANAPTPNPSATNHADENAKFQRDTHDMGKHQGQEIHGEDNGKLKGDSQDKDKEKEKGKKKSKGDDPQAVNDKEKEEKDKSAKEQESKGKGGKDKKENVGLDTEKEKGKAKKDTGAGGGHDLSKAKGGKVK